MNDYKLVYNCPGCGKPTTAPEGAITNRCRYCGLIVRIGSPHRVLKYFYPSRLDAYAARMAADRYLKRNKLPLTGKIIRAQFFYLPFYRFRGLALDYLAPEVKFAVPNMENIPAGKTKPKLKGKDFDVTIPAFSENDFHLASLGIRPNAVPLYAFVDSELPADAVLVGSVLTPSVAEKKALAMHRHNTSLYNKAEPLFSAMIDENVSVIYFPVWTIVHAAEDSVKTVFVDALARNGYLQTEGDFEFTGEKSTCRNSHYIKPTRHQCPNCGADLPEKHFSLFYPCANCGRSYLIADDGYHEVKCRSVRGKVGAPFWRFPLEFKLQTHYKTVRDFSRLLGSEPALLRRDKQGNRFYLYSPAFKSADVILWAKKALSVLRVQPGDRLSEEPPGRSLDLCIDEAEAREMAVFAWRVLTAKYARLNRPEFEITENNLPPGEIVWLPVDNPLLFGKAAGFTEVNIVKEF